MICSNCGNVNENENNFCKHCGHDLKAAADPNHSIFNYNPAKSINSNMDLGYLIIAILVLVNICTWIAWGFFSSSILNSSNEVLYKGIRVLTTLFSIAQFVVMLVFAKKQAYRMVIGVIGAFVVLYDLYYLIQTFMTNY